MLGLMIWALIAWLAYWSVKLPLTGFKGTPEYQSELDRPKDPQVWQQQAWERKWNREWNSTPSYTSYYIACYICFAVCGGAIINFWLL